MEKPEPQNIKLTSTTNGINNIVSIRLITCSLK